MLRYIMTVGNTPPVKATTTSTRILEALLDLDGANLTEVVNDVGLSKSSVHNHLETLDRLGFVVKDNQQYKVSLRFLKIGAHARATFPLFQAGRAEVDRLASASGLTTGIAVLERGECICIHYTVGQKVKTYPVSEGDVLPLHCTAPGKAILSELPNREVNTLLDDTEIEAFTDRTITDRSKLLDELETVRSRGLAADRGEWKAGLRAIAAGISDSDDQPLGAIFTLSPEDSMSGKRFQQDIPGLVISSANHVNQNLREPNTGFRNE